MKNSAQKLLTRSTFARRHDRNLAFLGRATSAGSAIVIEGWKTSANKALRVVIRGIRRVNRQLAKNLQSEFTPGHIASILYQVEDQQRACNRAQYLVWAVTRWFAGLETQVDELRRVLSTWSKSLASIRVDVSTIEVGASSDALLSMALEKLRARNVQIEEDLLALRSELKGDSDGETIAPSEYENERPSVSPKQQQTSQFANESLESNGNAIEGDAHA